MYVQVENLKGMTAELSERLKDLGIFSIDALARITDPEWLKVTAAGTVGHEYLWRMVKRSREVLRYEWEILQRLHQARLIAVEEDAEGGMDWHSEALESPQAHYGPRREGVCQHEIT